MLARKSMFLSNATRGTIVTSLVENVAGIASVLSVIDTTRPDCIALDYAINTPDVTLEQMANLKALFYVVFSFGTVIIWKSINHLSLRGRVDFIRGYGL